jgi:hypothetical protein
MLCSVNDALFVQISPDQMIQSASPLEVFNKFHDRFCLVIGQGKIVEIATKEYPYCTMRAR